MQISKALISPALILSLAYCSPYPYSPAVKKFATGTATVGSTLIANEATITEVKAELGRYRRRDLVSRPSMTFEADCRLPASSGKSCEQVERGVPPAPVAAVPGARPPPLPMMTALSSPPPSVYQCPVVPGTNEQPRLPKVENVQVSVELIATSLKEYSDSLAAVTNAADRAALDSAVGDLSKSAGTLASTVGMAAGPAASAAIGGVVSASVSLIGWIVGQAEDERRLAALDTALRATCRPMQVLGQTAETLIDARLREIPDIRLKAVDNIQHGMRAGMSRAEYFSRDAEIDTLIAAGVRPPDPQNQPGYLMRDAHDALVKAVNNREGQTLALITAVGAFADAAQKLQTALTKLPK
jgi:hypothetical protein